MCTTIPYGLTNGSYLIIPIKSLRQIFRITNLFPPSAFPIVACRVDCHTSCQSRVTAPSPRWCDKAVAPPLVPHLHHCAVTLLPRHHDPSWKSKTSFSNNVSESFFSIRWQIQFIFIVLIKDILHIKKYYSTTPGYYNEWMVFQATILHCKAILDKGQPGLMRWIMPLVQVRLLTCWPTVLCPTTVLRMPPPQAITNYTKFKLDILMVWICWYFSLKCGAF